MAQARESTLIGWQGISVWVPAEWTLGGVGGDRRQGYLRVDCEGMPRLQVKWARRHIELERKRDEYVRKLAARPQAGARGALSRALRVALLGFRGRGPGAGKRPSGIEVTTDERVVSRRAKPGKEMVSYGWRGPQCGVGLLWNCGVCGRAVIAQVGWPVEEEGREVAQQVLESLEDHGTGGWEAWGVDGLAFLAPQEYELEGWRRMTRYLEMRLARGGEKLKVARWGMVPLVLGRRTVREWYEESNARRRDVWWASGEEGIRGHEGVVARGEARAWSLKRAAWGALRMATRSERFAPASFQARAWHCPESNRLYLVEAVGEGLVDGVAESVRCCAAGQE